MYNESNQKAKLESRGGILTERVLSEPLIQCLIVVEHSGLKITRKRKDKNKIPAVWKANRKSKEPRLKPNQGPRYSPVLN